MTKVSRLRRVITTLARIYTDAADEPSDPFELILFENVAYLVDDDRRHLVFVRLRDEIGLTPKAILQCSAAQIASVIAEGGMRPPMRAEKLIECAQIADAQDLSELRSAIKTDAVRAKRMLRAYPGVGEPLADKILLFCGDRPSLAPDSNVLRVLIRLGFGREEKSYGATYRSVMSETSALIRDLAEGQRGHAALRKHGQAVCKRASPRCEFCAVRTECNWYTAHA
jgi:endonuclease III